MMMKQKYAKVKNHTNIFILRKSYLCLNFSGSKDNYTFVYKLLLFHSLLLIV